MIDLDQAGFAPVPTPALHIYRRVKILANGTTIWQCRQCGGRRCYPPIEDAGHIQLRPEDDTPHIPIHADSWPAWQRLRAKAPTGAQLQ